MIQKKYSGYWSSGDKKKIINMYKLLNKLHKNVINCKTIYSRIHKLLKF